MNKCVMSEWSVDYFESRGNRGARESESSREESTRVRLDLQKIEDIGGVARLERFVGENLVVDALMNFEPMSRFENRWNMGESRSFRNSMSSRVKNQMKTIELRTRKIQKKRIVYLGMNDQSSNSLSCSRMKPSRNVNSVFMTSVPRKSKWRNLAATFCRFELSMKRRLIRGSRAINTGWFRRIASGQYLVFYIAVGEF